MAKDPKDLKKELEEATCREDYEKKISDTIEIAENTVDTVKTAYSSVATAFAIGNRTVSLYNQIASSLNQETSPCRADDNSDPEGEQGVEFDLSEEIYRCLSNPSGEFQGQSTGCQSEIHAAFSEATSGDFDISEILDLINAITKSRSITQCISPYYDKFMNLVPVQFYIARAIEDTLGATLRSIVSAMSEDERKEFWKEIPCGEEEMGKIFSGTDFSIPPLPRITALPPIPNIRIPSLLEIIKNVFIDYLCWSMCCLLSNTLRWCTIKMNEMDKYISFEQFGSGELAVPQNQSMRGMVNLKK